MDSTSTSTASRFRFRDHTQQQVVAVHDYSSEGQTTADSSSISSDEVEDDSELQSMTAKGVQHLCSELLELKQESDEDFQKNIFSNYSAFIAILKEISGLQGELSGLKNQASSQKSLVKELTKEIYSRLVLSEETIESPILEEPLHIQPSFPNILETHTENISDIFDTLLSEQRLDDALALLEMEGDFFRNLHSGKTCSLDQLKSYDSTILEKRAMLSDQFTLVAKHPRTSAPELHKALFGLCQLGENHIATELLFQYYHSRISSGIHSLQSSKEFLDVLYMQRVAKYVFSVISQAVRSYVTLNEENDPYSSEFIQWACEEIEVFAACFVKYIKSISEISGRLSTLVHAVQIAMSYCSLLEAQRIFLQPYLVENVRPFIEEVLEIHIDHLSKVVSIITSNDTWDLGRYFVSGILIGRNYAIIDKQPEYIILTNSGRKFVTLFQSVAEDMLPLTAMQMENSVLRGLMNLFKAYIVILESALLPGETDMIEKGVLILANLTTLIQFSSSVIRNMFDGIHHLDFEIDNHLLFVQDMYSRLKAGFIEQFVANIFSRSASHESGGSEKCNIWQEDSRTYDMTPSLPYLELYLELNKLQKLAEDDFVDMNWLNNLFKDVMDATFEWISRKSDIWTVNIDNIADHQTKFVQFVLNTQFLVEIARCGNYLSDGAMILSKEIVSRLRQSFTTAGHRPLRDLDDDKWAENAAVRALQKLRELDANDSNETENLNSTREESKHPFEDEDAIDTNNDFSRTENIPIEKVDSEEHTSTEKKEV
ncbi:hypothetical protein ACJIZ3_011873 [Penstemon smallii]|uniref:Exocyst component Exo84 C-terminal domain-containing protein n=1 Tax=Penstemon smallii TaxID=265156 RepID=A0ABD3UMJ2_9LAMI